MFSFQGWRSNERPATAAGDGPTSAREKYAFISPLH